MIFYDSQLVRQSVSYYTDEIFEVWSGDKFFRDLFFGNIKHHRQYL